MAAPKGPRGQGRQRVLDAALPLFAEYGVRGTSLQMIAERLGVTKAAVYHQFHAKEDIALALLEPMFAAMAETVDRAEQTADESDRLAVALEGLVDLVLAQQSIAFALDRDVEMERLVAEHEEYAALVRRLQSVLLGPDPNPRRLVTITMFGSGLISVVRDKGLATAMDQQRLRAELLAAARRMFD